MRSPPVDSWHHLTLKALVWDWPHLRQSARKSIRSSSIIWMSAQPPDQLPLGFNEMFLTREHRTKKVSCWWLYSLCKECFDSCTHFGSHAYQAELELEAKLILWPSHCSCHWCVTLRRGGYSKWPQLCTTISIKRLAFAPRSDGKTHFCVSFSSLNAARWHVELQEGPINLMCVWNQQLALGDKHKQQLSH